MLFRNIVFDLDGTLIDSVRLTGAIIDQMLRKRGAGSDADRALIRQMDAIGGETMIATVMGRYSTDPAAEIEEFRRIHRTIDIPADLAFPGIREALERLAEKGVKLAICSNKPQFLCDRILAEMGLARYFEAIVGSAPGRRRKPDPETALLALAGLGGTSCDTLYCGDSHVDVRTARAAGLTVALVEWGYGTAEALRIEPDITVIDSLRRLPDSVDGHGRLHVPG